MKRSRERRSRDALGRSSAFSHRTTARMCVAVTALTIVGVASAPSAAADPDESLRAAVTAVRAAQCPPLHSLPVIDDAAEKINKTTDDWINFASRAVPETDAVPVLNDLGYPASKAKILSGAAKNFSDSVKATLLQGFAVLPDCSYTDFGVSSIYNARKDLMLVTVVLAA